MANTHPILITGGTQRIGLCCAQTLLKHGFDIIVTYRTEKPAIEQLRQQGVDCVFADFSSDSGINRFIDSINSDYDGLRAIVHNASTWLPDDEDNLSSVFEEMMNVHAKAPLMINYGLKDLLNGSEADIVHLSDFVAQVGSEKHIAYAASKAALDNLTRSFARKFAPKIKVNGIAPSLIQFNEHDDAEYRNKTLKKSLLGIEPGPQVVAETLLYILQNTYLTGRTIELDGGRHLKLP